MGLKMDFTRKGKTTEGKGLTGYPLAKRFSLASPSMLLPSNPLLPIPKSPTSPMASKMFHGEQETGKPGTGLDQEIRQKQLTSERKGSEASLPYITGGEMKKGSLGLPLIQPIRKAGSLLDDAASGFLQSSPQMDLQEFREMRPGSSSRSHVKSSEHAASSESTTKSQRKEEKSSQCKTGPGMPVFPRELSDLFSLETPVPDPGLGNGGLGSRLAQGALAQEPQEHGSASERDLTGYSPTKRFSLVFSHVPLPRKSLSPIQKRCLSLKTRKRPPSDQIMFQE